MEKKTKVTRKEARTHLEAFQLSCELAKVIRHFFPQLLSLLRQVPDPRHQSYVIYENYVLLMTKILSSIFYISSMRKTSEEFNNSQAIENIGLLCGKEELTELPYWETINDYLKRIDAEALQNVATELVRRLLRMRVFEDARIKGKYWQVLLDGTQLYSSREELPGYYLYRRHHKGTENEYKEYYYYLLEAKLVLGEKIVVSILSVFVENEDREPDKQDCELKAAYRLMERLKKEFPHLPVCLCGDSLYAGAPFMKKCKENGFRYLLRFKEGSIPYIYGEYQEIRELEGNHEEEKVGKGTIWYDHVRGIEYEGKLVNMLEYGESWGKYNFYFITDLSVSRKDQKGLIRHGRDRWLIENQGFNEQKKQGYHLEHRYSKDYQGMKNHYYLIQIGHMIAQILEAVETIWEKQRESKEQKHKRMLEAIKTENLKEYREELSQRKQIRLKR